MERLLRIGGQGIGGMGSQSPESSQNDTAEQVLFSILNFSKLDFFQIHISSLALLKMMKHGRAGVPFEVMGLMLGEFVDDYTVRYVLFFRFYMRTLTFFLLVRLGELILENVFCIVI